MKPRRLPALASVLVIALLSGCNVDRQVSGVRATQQPPADIISDGAHGGNHDFFFLPPLVPLPLNNPDFELGKFDNTLAPILSVEICELAVTDAGLPTAASACRAVDASHPLTKKFAAGSVQVVNLPLRQNGWWTLLGLPPDGFYYVLWDTRQAQPKLSLNKYYRIKVFVNGSTDPLGYADVDPMGSLREWKSSLTSQVIQLVDGTLLPIPFRVEKGQFCVTGSALCKSVIVGNDNPNGTSTIVPLQGPAGTVAGAEFPDGWLPAGGPQSVIVSISSVPDGARNSDGSRSIQCHQGLPLIQFDGCFKFTTTPTLPTVNGAQFAQTVRVAVCYVLHDTNNPLRDWAELWSSGPYETTRPLPGAPDASILTNHDCANPDPVITMSDNPVARLAQTGWHKLSEMFTVPTAHAVDLGLGGLTKGFSNIGPALTAQLIPHSSTEITGTTGEQVFVQARIIGTQTHNGEPLGDVTLTGHTHGLPGVPVTFTIVAGNDASLVNGDNTSPTQLTVTSSDYDDSSLSGGFASVLWTLPSQPGTYTLIANAPALGGPVTYTATVTSPVVTPTIDGVMNAGEWAGAATYDFTANLPGGGTTPATLFVKNDNDQLYLAVRFTRTSVDAGENRLQFEFDANNDGVGPVDGDDYYGYQQTPSAVFFDAYRRTGGVTDDTQPDGTAAFQNDGASSVYEISHPLNSGQAGQDFALAGGSTIGLFFQLVIGSTTTTYPGTFIHYLPITITGG